MQLTSEARPTGVVAARKLNEVRPVSLTWTLKNRLRWGFIKGAIAAHIVAPVANWWGIATLMGELSIKVRHFYDPAEGAYFKALVAQGRHDEAESYAGVRTWWEDYGVVCHRVITDAGVTFLRDDWNADAKDFTTFNYHGIGTGTGTESASDTALGTESTTALAPDSTRATGTRSVPASNQFRSVGTLTADADIAVTEHGLLSQAATGGGTLWDRSKFAAINLVGASGDSIQVTYTCTLTSGG